MRILYFAWLRQRVGRAEEAVTPPREVVTLGDLVRWLAARDDAHAAAFRDMRAVRAAVNQQVAPLERAVHYGDEIAFFPPMTGG